MCSNHNRRQLHATEESRSAQESRSTTRLAGKTNEDIRTVAAKGARSKENLTNMAAKRSIAVSIILNLAAFIVTLIFSQLSTRLNDIFPRTQGEISGTNQTEITPASSTFAIWGFIYLYQAAWILYSITWLWRGDSDILPPWFYLSYSIGNISSVCWLIVWSRGHLTSAFFVLALLAVSMDITMYWGMTGLANYLEGFPKNDRLPNKIDVWCVRLLVLNGVVTYTAWVSIASCLNLCISLQHDLGVDGTKAATGVIFVLFFLITTWFFVENFIFERFTRFIFMEYVVFIIGSSGILKKQWTNGLGNQGFVLFILILSSVMLVARLSVIYYKETKFTTESSNVKFILRKIACKGEVA